MFTIFFGSKVISSDASYKINQNYSNFIEVEELFFTSDQHLLDTFEQYDLIFVPQSFEKEYFKMLSDTLVSIDAAGGVVTNSKNELLMIFRLGKWDLPKGKREMGEDMATCALREVEEECGVTNLILEGFRSNTYHIYSLNDRLVLKTTAWYNMTLAGDVILTPQREEDITDVCWIEPSKIKGCLLNSYPTITSLLNIE